MIYFTADLHLGHANIINFCERPFDNIHQMDCAIIENINNTVKSHDILYILGDFSYRGKKPIHYRSQLICQNIHIILGNHDKQNNFPCFRNVDPIQTFQSCQHVKEVKYCKQRIYLSHYPHRSWPGSHHGSWMLYGHVHSRLNHEDTSRNYKTLDVGVDNNINYSKPFGQPWSYEEIYSLFEMRTASR